MSILLFLVPIALFLGGLGLVMFVWSLKSGQFDDLDGDARRILLDDVPTTPNLTEVKPKNGTDI